MTVKNIYSGNRHTRRCEATRSPVCEQAPGGGIVTPDAQKLAPRTSADVRGEEERTERLRANTWSPKQSRFSDDEEASIAFVCTPGPARRPAKRICGQ